MDDNDVFVSLPVRVERNALTEPADDTDLTAFQMEVLHREDAANDEALRDIVPDDCYTFNWSNNRRTFLGRREVFDCAAGPTFDVSDHLPTDVFYKIFDTDLIDRMCTETNRYAQKTLATLREQNRLKPQSRFNRWTPTDRDEMISFLALIILQGLYPLTEEEAYFKFNGYGTMQYFAKVMSYNRFLLLKTFLHFVDSEQIQDSTRLCKIRPIIDHFNDKFCNLYMPSQEIAIDESLLKWHGRLSFAQKISTKAAQVGVKTYELCESSSGYLWKFFVYTGKQKPTTATDSTSRRPDEQTDRPDEDRPDEDRPDEDRPDEDRPDEDRPDEDRPDEDRPDTDRPDDDGPIVERRDDRNDELVTGDGVDRPDNITAKIVYDLIEPLLNRGHTVIMDNFYNSPLLARSLKRQKTDCFGTLRLNREFVPASIKTLTKTELRRQEAVATYCSDLAIMVWRDSNVVSMISTYHNLQAGPQDKHNKRTWKPKIVLDYNKSMGGVDRKDQFLSAQPLERIRNKIWYKKLFRRLYNSAVFNCFVIYSSAHRNVSHRQFRTVLAEELLKRHRQIDLTTESRLLNVRSNTTGQVVTTTMRRNVYTRLYDRPIVEHNHFPTRTGSKNTICRVCTKKTRTIWKCEECDVPMCVEFCFKAFHKP